MISFLTTTWLWLGIILACIMMLGAGVFAAQWALEAVIKKMKIINQCIIFIAYYPKVKIAMDRCAENDPEFKGMLRRSRKWDDETEPGNDKEPNVTDHRAPTDQAQANQTESITGSGASPRWAATPIESK